MKFLFLLMTLAGSMVFSQDYRMPVSSESRQGFSFETYPLPDNIQLSKIDRSKVMLDTQGKLTFVQVWSICCGGEPDIWAQALDIAEMYKGNGLQTISINFENGAGLKAQIAEVKDYFTKNPPPENLFFDGLGYVTDFLNVTGFPTYYLVDKNNQVVFRTNGKDPEGMKLFRQEIEKRLE